MRVPCSACNYLRFPRWTQYLLSSAPVQHRRVHTSGWPSSGWRRPELVIFDKNGTLVDFHNYWSPRMHGFVKRLESDTGLKLKDSLYEQLAICSFTGKARPGPLAHSTAWQLRREVEEHLVTAGLARGRAHWAVELCWQLSCPKDSLSTQPLADLPALFKQLKAADLKVAVCTSDMRGRTVEDLGCLGEQLDMLLCGDDSNSVPKPSGHNVTLICHTLGVQPDRAVMVGDTQADMQMAKEAGVEARIGVLSGIGTRLDLRPWTTHIVPGVSEAAQLIMSGRAAGRAPASTRLSPDTPTTSGPVSTPTQPPTTTTTTTTGRAQGQGEAAHVDRETRKKASLVIFDKDGTLLCFNSVWTPFAETIVERLETFTGLELRHRVLKELGFCHETNTWMSGVFAKGTMAQAQQTVSRVLEEAGLSPSTISQFVTRAWEKSDGTLKPEWLKPLDDPLDLFRTLKDSGIKVALCTADSRTPTVEWVEYLGLEKYIDAMVCGDDTDAVPKPAPQNALHICKQLDIDPAETVVVGDTTADLGMGRSAGLGATIGVLSGVGDVQELDPQADYLVPSISHVLDIVLPSKVAAAASCNVA